LFSVPIMVLFMLCPKMEAMDSGVKIENMAGDEKVTFHSGVLDEERTILVHLPKGYALSEERYPTLYVLDAEFFFHQAASARFADWVLPNEMLNDGFEGIHLFYEKLSKEHGFVIDIPESAYFRLASKYFNEGDENKAFEIAKEYVARFPKSSYAHYYLGMRAKAVDDLPLARKSFSRAINLEESSLEPYAERMIICHIFLQDIEKELEMKRQTKRGASFMIKMNTYLFVIYVFIFLLVLGLW
jgi:tetratricopeptide (TPR) repeat protein